MPPPLDQHGGVYRLYNETTVSQEWIAKALLMRIRTQRLPTDSETPID